MKFLNTIFYSLIITFCLTKNAYAYLDPGAITAFIQLLVAGIAEHYLQLNIGGIILRILFLKLLEKNQRRLR